MVDLDVVSVRLAWIGLYVDNHAVAGRDDGIANIGSIVDAPMVPL
jgi:hypothetical protein